MNVKSIKTIQSKRIEFIFNQKVMVVVRNIATNEIKHYTCKHKFSFKSNETNYHIIKRGQAIVFTEKYEITFGAMPIKVNYIK